MSSSGTVDSSAQQLGASHISAFHHTLSAGWDTGSSGDISSLSSSVVSDGPCKKEATLAWSCGGSPKSESAPSDPIPLEGRLASCRLATEAGLTLPFPAPIFRSTTVTSLPPRAGMGFLPIQPFDLFFQSCCGRQGFPMCFVHSG